MNVMTMDCSRLSWSLALTNKSPLRSPLCVKDLRKNVRVSIVECPMMLTTLRVVCQGIDAALALSIAGIIDRVPLVHDALKCILKMLPGLLSLRLHRPLHTGQGRSLPWTSNMVSELYNLCDTTISEQGIL